MSEVKELGRRAQAAKRVLATASETMRNAALRGMAASIRTHAAEILAANADDLDAGRQSGLTDALLDRLALDESRIEGICASIEKIAGFDDPLGIVLKEFDNENGLHIRKVTVPIGVIAVIFEARPNVAADSAALCLKSGNAVLLRGGKEAIRSNTALVSAMRKAVEAAGLPADSVQLVTDTTRESANELMRLNESVDLLIPRGGRGLIRSVVDNASVPVIETGAGVCHIYIDKDADLEMAANILFNAKVSRPSVCNAAECALVHRDVAAAFLPMAKAKLDAAHVEIRGDEETRRSIDAVPATEDDWGREYNDYILACRVVGSVEEAVEHIYRYGTKHSEAIVTRDASAADYFLKNVDAAAVYVNASTRFTDGGVFGLGAEIGISTQKLHARGPLGVAELTSYKYEITGNGQVR